MHPEGPCYMSRFACICIAMAVIVTVGLVGCGSDTEPVTPDPAQPRPHPDNATVSGRVVAADNVSMSLAQAEVTEPTTGRMTVTDGGGYFRLTGLPAGANTRIVVTCPRTPNYESASVTVRTEARKATTVNIAVLPVGVGTPTSLILSPSGDPPPDVEQGGKLQFGAAVYVGRERVDVQPTWILSGDGVGVIDASGMFTATRPGTGLITAIAGELVATSSVIVTGPRPPQITSVLVSASPEQPVPASGGPVMITAAINDADGIRSFDAGPHKGLKFEIYAPDGSVLELTPGEPEPGTTIYDGTWRLTYSVPPNSNLPDATGRQAPQTYSVRVVARDLTGAVSYSQFHDFVVLGLDAPPPPAG